MAGRLVGVDLATRDLDIVPAMGPANLQRRADALSALRPRWRIDQTSPEMSIDGRLESVGGVESTVGALDDLIPPRPTDVALRH